MEENIGPCNLDLTTGLTSLREVEHALSKRLKNLNEDINGTLLCLSEYASHYRQTHIMLPVSGSFSPAEPHFTFLDIAIKLLSGRVR